MVAPGGFTSEAHEAVKRLSGEPYTMVLVKGDDLRVLADGEESVLDWLESLLCRIAWPVARSGLKGWRAVLASDCHFQDAHPLRGPLWQVRGHSCHVLGECADVLSSWEQLLPTSPLVRSVTLVPTASER